MAKPSAAQAPEKSATLPVRHPGSPFELMRSFSNEMDRMFADFGLRHRWPFSFLTPEREGQLWSPDLEVEEREGKLFVRADLPGLRKEDVNVEVTDDTLTIRGERRHEEEKKGEGYYRSERSYGRFTRSVALPDGANAETARATFKDGVLEIAMDVPPRRTTSGRKLEISS